MGCCGSGTKSSKVNLDHSALTPATPVDVSIQRSATECTLESGTVSAPDVDRWGSTMATRGTTLPQKMGSATQKLLSSCTMSSAASVTDSTTTLAGSRRLSGCKPHVRRESTSKACEMIRSAAVGRPFPKRPLGCKLSQRAWEKMERLFNKMDPDGSNAVTREEAKSFFKCAFGQLSVDAMFNEVDVDRSGAIDSTEFSQFWIHVRKNGYGEQDICDELDELIEGGAWVDWKDGRDAEIVKRPPEFPKRPLMCRISQNCWDACRELFKKIDADGQLTITREKAGAHFRPAFGSISADAMFNEVDQNHHGQITPKEWMKFWVQVKAAGYKEQDILDEIEQLMDGSTWVDWKDGRSVA